MSAMKECPKKLTMKEKEIESLIDKIKSYWPDLIITEGHLKKPTPSFVYSFYSRFFEEYEKKFHTIQADILQQESDLDMNPCMDEASLAIVLKKICRQFELNPFYLNDIYEPQPKRTILYFKIFMNFLLYINSDESVEELSKKAQKSRNLQDLHMEKQNLIDESNNLKLLSVQVEESMKQHVKKIENISGEYQNVMKQKADKEKQHQEDIKLIKKLKENCQALDENIQRLYEDSALYHQQIVDEADVNQIKLKIDELEKKMAKLDMDRSEIVSTLETQEGTNKHFSECFQSLHNSNFSSDYLNHLNHKFDNLTDQIQEIKRLTENISDKRVEINNYEKENAQLLEECLILKKELPALHIQNDEHVKNLKSNIESLLHTSDVAGTLETKIVEVNRIINYKKEELSDLESSFSHKYDKWINCLAAAHHHMNNALLNIRQELD